MSFKLIRQTSSSMIRLRSNPKRTDLALFREQHENASMSVVALAPRQRYRSSRARPQTLSYFGGTTLPAQSFGACPPIVIRRANARTDRCKQRRLPQGRGWPHRLTVARSHHRGGKSAVSVRSARDGARIERPGRGNGSAGGRTRMMEGKEAEVACIAAGLQFPLRIGASKVVEQAD
jgi:hypothetical protein